MLPLPVMFPVLFSIGNISVSSFGVFLGLGFLVGVFLIWRLSRAWDLDEEKILDLTLLTFVTGLVGARIYFVLENWSYFAQNLSKIILFTQSPGFSFWGAFLGGWLGLLYFTRRLKIDFWQISDIAAIGFLAGIIFGQLGCFLGGCNIGVVSNFLSVPVVGVVGKRFPIQLLEALLLSLVLIKLWSQATHFHQRGKIISLALIFLGLIGMMLEPLKAFHGSLVFSAVLFVLGVTIFYRVMRRNIVLDLKYLAFFIKELIVNSNFRKTMLLITGKYWYNQKVLFWWQLRNITKWIRRLNVKFSHKNSKFN